MGLSAIIKVALTLHLQFSFEKMKTKLFIEISEGFGEYIHAKGLKLTTRKELSYCIEELQFRY
jgi:hypothetical protein